MSADDLGLRQVDEKEELEQRDRDLMEWVEGLADHKFSEEGEWLDECRTGVILCKVLGSISSETAVSFNVKPKGVWNYRDNISSYLDKLKAIDVLMFEVEELVELSKPGNVKSSLHDLARVAFERYGIPLPGATKAGAEIDAEAEVAEEDVDKIAQEVMLTLSQQQLPMVDLDADEDDDASAPNKSMLISMSGGLNLNSPAKDLHLSMAGGLNFDAIADDPIDQAVEKALLARSRDPAYNSEEGIQVVRLKRGQYLLLPLKKVFFCRILSGHLMVRVGGGWESFEVWLSRNKGFSGAPPQTFGMRRPGSMRRMEVDKERKGSVAERDVLERKGSIKRKDSYVRNLSFQKRGSFRRSGSFQRSKSEVQDPVERSATMGARREESFDRTGSFQKKGTVTRSVSVDRTGSFHRRVERKVSGTNPKKPRKAEPPTYEEANPLPARPVRSRSASPNHAQRATYLGAGFGRSASPNPRRPLVSEARRTSPSPVPAAAPRKPGLPAAARGVVRPKTVAEPEAKPAQKRSAKKKRSASVTAPAKASKRTTQVKSSVAGTAKKVTTPAKKATGGLRKAPLAQA